MAYYVCAESNELTITPGNAVEENLTVTAGTTPATVFGLVTDGTNPVETIVSLRQTLTDSSGAGDPVVTQSIIKQTKSNSSGLFLMTYTPETNTADLDYDYDCIAGDGEVVTTA